MITKNSNEYLFVYGTLRNDINHSMSAILQRYTKDGIPGWFTGKLYDVGSFPAAVSTKNSSHKVRGELYEITNTDALFHRLDPYEGYDENNPSKSLYIRKRVAVRTKNKREFSAWTYLYNRSIDQLSSIPSGDYLKYLEKNSKGNK